MSELRNDSSTSKISSLYRYLWSIPLPGDLLHLTVIFSTLALLSILLAGNLLERFFLVVPGFYFPIILNYLFSRLYGLGMANFRRLNQVTIITMIFLIVGGLTLLAPFGKIFSPILIGFGIFLRVIIILTFADRDYVKSISFLTASMMAEAVPPILLSRNYVFKVVFSSSYLAGIISASVLFITLERFYHARGIPLMRYLTALLSLLLDGRREPLEEIAKSFDDKSDIVIDLLIFREKGSSKPGLVVMIPGYHPGPFRDFGSSGLSYMIAERLKTVGIDFVFFKGLSSHINNIVSMEDCIRIVEEVLRVVKESGGEQADSSIGTSMAIQSGDAKGLLLPIGGSKLLFLTLHPNGMEDIPPSLINAIADDMIIIDCHNSFSDKIKELDGDSLLRLREVVEIASNIRQEGGSTLYVGYSRVSLNQYSLKDGIGPLGISALLLGSGKGLTAIIVLDGNNAVPEVREEILRRLANFRFFSAEVLTTDTHMVNGLELGGRGYHPLGEIIPPKILAEAAFKAVSDALDRLKPMAVERIKLRLEGMQVMSENFLDEAERITSKGLKVFLFTAVSAPLLSLLLSLILT